MPQYILLFLVLFKTIKSNEVVNDDYPDLIIDQNQISKPDDENNIIIDILSGQAPYDARSQSFIDTVEPYKSKLRPSGIIGKNKNIDENGSLKLTVMLSLRQIVSVDERNQILTSSFYLLCFWQDPRLMWDPSRYNGVKTITVGASNFWLPDLAIMNAAASNNFISYGSSQNVLISYDGYSFLTVSLPSQATRCSLNVYTYPFDYQNCSIIIGSWLNNNREINFMLSDRGYDIKNYIVHPTWKLEKIQQYLLNDTSRFQLANFQLKNSRINTIKAKDIAFHLILKRNPLYIMINGVFPCFVLNLVILIAFGVPFAQQVTLCMTSFLTFVTSSLRISGDIPVQSEYMPLITLYFAMSFFYTFLGFLWFIIIDMLSKKKKLPDMLQKLAYITQKALFIVFNDVNCNKVKPEQDKLKIIDLDLTTNQDSSSANDLKQPLEIPKCNFCNRCEECQSQYQKEKKEKQDSDSLKLNVLALNYLAFFFLFFTILTCNLAIWSSMRMKTPF